MASCAARGWAWAGAQTGESQRATVSLTSAWPAPTEAAGLEGRDGAATAGEGRRNQTILLKRGRLATFTPRQRRAVSCGFAARQMRRGSWSRRRRKSICRHIWRRICGIVAMLRIHILVHKSLGAPVCEQRVQKLRGLTKGLRADACAPFGFGFAESPLRFASVHSRCA